MAVLIKTGSSHETVLHNTNLKLKNTKLESLKENLEKTFEKNSCFLFLYFDKPIFSCPFSFYILLFSISIAYL